MLAASAVLAAAPANAATLSRLNNNLVCIFSSFFPVIIRQQSRLKAVVGLIGRRLLSSSHQLINESDWGRPGAFLQPATPKERRRLHVARFPGDPGCGHVVAEPGEKQSAASASTSAAAKKKDAGAAGKGAAAR